MTTKWFTAAPGIRYCKLATRKHGARSLLHTALLDRRQAGRGTSRIGIRRLDGGAAKE